MYHYSTKGLSKLYVERLHDCYDQVKTALTTTNRVQLKWIINDVIREVLRDMLFSDFPDYSFCTFTSSVGITEVSWQKLKTYSQHI